MKEHKTAGNVARAATAMFLVGTLAGVSGLIKDYPVYSGQAVRYAVAAIILLVTARLLGLRFVRLTPRETLLTAALSLLGLVFFNVCVIEATRHAGPALVGTILGTVPLALALLGGRRPAAHVVAGAAVVVTGATLATGLGSGDLTALLWSLGALACEVAFSLLAIPLLPKLGAIRVSAYSVTLAVPMLLVIGVGVEGAGMFPVPTTAQLLGLAYLSVVVTTVAFFLWYSALPRLGPAVAGLFAGMIPIGAITTGVVLGVATPTGPDLLGAGLVITGIVIGLYGRRPRRPAAVEPSLDGARV
jgi:drug/metabolite transporter (DMT)-like permease